MGIFQAVKKRIPSPGWKPLLAAFVFQCLVYSGTRLLTAGWAHAGMAIPLDSAVPFLPWTVSVYVGAYVFWFVGYNLAVWQGGDHAWQFLAADILGKAVCLVFFLALPTAMARPEVPEGATLGWMLNIIYALDTPDNLFPSIHCLDSWLCWAAVRDRKNVPAWVRRLFLVFALAVAVSTLTTRQHVLADVVSGLALGELCWQTAGHTPIARLYRCVWRMEKQKGPL